MSNEEIERYENEIPDKWRESYFQLKQIIKENIPEGFQLTMQYGFPTYVVPLSEYSEGYLNRKNEPLPFLSLGVQKHHLALYHMGIMGNPILLDWFTAAYKAEVATKLNMGKSCIRFTNPKNIPVQLIGTLVTKMSMKEWIEQYVRVKNNDSKKIN